MALDPSVIASGIRPVQPIDPMQTLAQVAQFQNMQLARQDAQQRIQLQQDALDLRQEAAARKVKDEEDARAGQAVVAPLQLGRSSLKEVADTISQIQDPAVRNVAIETFTKFRNTDSEIAQRMAAAGKNDADVIRLQTQQIADLARDVRDVGKYSPGAIEFAFKVARTSRMANPDTLDLLHERWLENSGPEASKALIDGLITQGGQEVTLNRGDLRVTPTGGTLAQGAAPEAKDYTGFDAYIRGPFAKAKGKKYEELTDKDWDEAREKYRLDERISVNVRNTQAVDEGFSKLPVDSRLAFRRATNDLSVARKRAWTETINDAYANGRESQIPGMVMQAAIESENPDDQRIIMGRRNMAKSMTDLAGLVQQVPTGFLKGTVEQTARALGDTTDPALVRLKARIDAGLANYRKATTGAAFSDLEQQEYVKRFPNYKNDVDVNMSVIQGFLDDLNANDEVYWETKLGAEGAKLVGALKPVNVLAPAAAAPGAAPAVPGSSGDSRWERYRSKKKP